MSDNNDALDLRELLNKPAGDFPDLPDLPPAKTFYGKIIGMVPGLSTQKQTPYFEFKVRLTDPGEDVDKREMDKIREAGFSLADYDTIAQFYLTPNAMKMFRRFQESLGLPINVPIVEVWKLDPQTLNPTDETQDLIRGRDVICRTGAKDDKGRVYRRLDSIAGIKRD